MNNKYSWNCPERWADFSSKSLISNELIFLADRQNGIKERSKKQTNKPLKNEIRENARKPRRIVFATPSPEQFRAAINNKLAKRSAKPDCKVNGCDTGGGELANAAKGVGRHSSRSCHLQRSSRFAPPVFAALHQNAMHTKPWLS